MILNMLWANTEPSPRMMESAELKMAALIAPNPINEIHYRH